MVQRAAPDGQAYVLAQAVLEVERAEVAALNAEYRAAKAELDKAERERKAVAAAAAAAAAPTPTPPPSAPAPRPAPASVPVSVTASAGAPVAQTSNATTATMRLPYYPPPINTAATSSFATTPSTYHSQYRNYTYPYAQPYGTPYSYTPPAPPSASVQMSARKWRAWTRAAQGPRQPVMGNLDAKKSARTQEGSRDGVGSR